LLVTEKCCVTLCYTIFSLISESTILLPGPLLFSGIGLGFLGSWSWVLELSGLELLGSRAGFGVFCWGCWPGSGPGYWSEILILNPGSELLHAYYGSLPIIYMNLKISIMSYESPSREWLIAEIESELGNPFTPFDLDAWTTSDLENMYNSIIGSM